MAKGSKQDAEAQASAPEGTDVQASASEAPALPSALVVMQPYGFIDDWGDRWHWHTGDVVHNPYVVGLLLERGAPVSEA